MSTRSHIVKVNDDNTCLVAYCHHDGYLQGVGKTLVNHYNNQEAINKLFDKGLDIVGLSPTVEETKFFKEESEFFNGSFEDYLKTMQNDPSDIEFIYWWKDNHWSCYDCHKKQIHQNVQNSL